MPSINISTARNTRFCGVVPLPNHDTDWIRMFSAFMMNQYNRSQDPVLLQWLFEHRLDGFSRLMRGVAEDDTEKQAILQRMRANVVPAVGKLQKFMAEIHQFSPLTNTQGRT